VTWIKTIPIQQADEKLRSSIEEQSKLYPADYAIPVDALIDCQKDGPAIVMAHSLMPDVLKHTFSAFGAMMSPDLPLERRHHEMIAATVSSLNSCFY